MTRRPAAQTNRKPRQVKVKAFPAPTKGWIANENLAVSTPQGAAILENWFPTATTVRLRKGQLRWATIDPGTDNIRSLFTYKAGAVEKLFAATDNAIYDITAPASPYGFLIVDEDGNEIVSESGDILGAEGVTDAEIFGLTGGEWVSVQFSTPDGIYLRLVNGDDEPLVYDGSTFDTVPAITGTDLTPSNLSFAWSFKNRMWFIEKGTMDAWYLPVDQIGGVATKFPLGAQFSRGGELVFGASWSLDDGGGLSASCIFVTSEGEVAVYQGSNPGDANDWSLKGVYRIGKPLGHKAFMRAGGDLVIATDVGFVPLSQAIQRDFAALSPVAVSYPIETAWNAATNSRPLGRWAVDVWPTQQMAIIGLPVQDSSRDEVYVVNVRTGAWGLFTGIGANCFALFQDRMVYGGKNGRIVQLESTGYDEGRTYTGSCAPLFDDLKDPSSIKIPRQARATLIATSETREALNVLYDYNVGKPPAPDATTGVNGSAWGIGRWGEATWGASPEKKTYQTWQSVGGSGYSVSPLVQITSGSVAPVEVEIVRIEMTYEAGDVVS
jgi:hypothetical protein